MSRPHHTRSATQPPIPTLQLRPELLSREDVAVSVSFVGSDLISIKNVAQTRAGHVRRQTVFIQSEKCEATGSVGEQLAL